VQQLTPYFKAASQVLNTLESKSQLASWPDKIAVVLPSQPLISPTLNASVVEQVEQALLTEMQLQISYQKRGEPNPQTLTVHPLGLILRGQVNYLCATIFNYQDIVLLPVHRILEAKMLDLPANRPEDFHLHSFAESGALGFVQKGNAKVKLQFKKSAGLHLYETPLSLDQVITEENEFLIVEATVVLRCWLDSFLLQLHHGWRGKKAIHWSLFGFIMLLLAYVGSRFVVQVILNK
jgi:predicted DNA-binding transcriptional regulator YafY